MSVTESVLRISDEKTLELVELYKKEECLWNTTCVEYKNKMRRRQAAQRIAYSLKIPNFEAHHVMTKFKNLRNAFCQELKKMAITQNLSLDEDAQPRKSKPKAQWYAVMDSFIRPHLQANYSYGGPTLTEVAGCYLTVKPEPSEQASEVTPIKVTVINGGIIKREPEPEPIDDPDELWDIPVAEEVVTDTTAAPQSPGQSAEDFECTEESEVVSSLTSKRPATRTAKSGTTKKMRTEDILAESLKEVSSQLADLKNDISNKEYKPQLTEGAQKEDYHDSFGKYIASLLRLLPKQKALLIQAKLVNVIAREVLGGQEDE